MAERISGGAHNLNRRRLHHEIRPFSTSLNVSRNHFSPALVLRGTDLRSHLGEDVVAGGLAATARLDADAAVFVMPGVVLALLRAGLEAGARHLGLRSRLPRENPASGVADVGTVEPYAARQHLYVSLAYAGAGLRCS